MLAAARVAILPLLVAASAAAEQPIRGLSFSITEPRTGAGRAERTVRIRALEPVPRAVLDGNPAVHGATLIVGALGARGTRQTFALPPGAASGRGAIGWRVRRQPRLPGHGSFTYVDRRGERGAVRMLRLTRTRRALRLDVRIARDDVALRPPHPGVGGGLALAFPGGETYCVGFGGPAGGRVIANRVRRFRMARAARAACVPPDVPAAVVTFDSEHVRPVALAPDGRRLFVVNTPAARLELFDVGDAGDLTHRGSVPVGLEPVAVAARSAGEVWVVNHVSDSISVVDVAASPPRVVRTILTCDEPRDLVFAGGRAFVTTARRGQNCVGADGLSIDPRLTTPGTPRALVQVFDPASRPGDALGDTPAAVVELFGDTPRALAVSPGGDTVYAAVFRSGNRTTTIHEQAVCDGGAGTPACSVGGAFLPGGLPFPNPVNCRAELQPETGLIVGFDPATATWTDSIGRDWSAAVRFELPDLDVFALDAGTMPPPVTRRWSGVGTVLFNMVANPLSGVLYVSNTDANNRTRFEGDRAGSCTASTLRGRLHQARISVLDGAGVAARHLNKHLASYDGMPTEADRARSLATPLGMATDGRTLWVAAFGSGVVGVLDVAALEQDTFMPDTVDHITVSGGGPSGLVLGRDRLYVTTRFDNGVSVVDTAARTEIAHVVLHDAEPAAVKRGRPFLYDAARTSANGEASCAACHVFGDLDGLAWDLGDPDGRAEPNPNPVELPGPQDFGFAPMKGPMTTQTLRGLAHHGPLHWRGDRTGASRGGDPLDVAAAFREFNRAFPALLGRESPLTDDEMQAFADFMLQVSLPPNPIRALDNHLSPAEAVGRRIYFDDVTDGVRTCNGCHVLDVPRGLLGTDGDTAFVREPQVFKIPHLRTAYQKVGMFGLPQLPTMRQRADAAMGPQVRGFGFMHDGSIDTVARFLSGTVFTLSTSQARDVEQFLFAFDSNLAPIVGQQITRTATNAGVAGPRIDLLLARAAAAIAECDVVVHGVLDGVARGWVREATGKFRSDRRSDSTLSDAELRAQADVPGQERTFTCVPPGSGRRMGIDRDADGCPDGDDLLPDEPGPECSGS